MLTNLRLSVVLISRRPTPFQCVYKLCCVSARHEQSTRIQFESCAERLSLALEKIRRPSRPMGKYLQGQCMQLRFRLLAISVVFVVVSGLDNSCRHHERFVSPDQSPIRVGGLFSVHRQRVNAINGQTQCTTNDPSTKPAFHRYAVEQVEALVFAATKTEMGYAIWDTCGQLHTACPVEQAKSLNADNGVIATLIGPYYSVGSNRIDKFNIERLYREIADGAETTRRRGVLPFLDEPFLDDYATKLGETLVYVQQSCLLQSRAVVDFATAAGWRAVAVVTSDDNCGRESVAEFRRATRERGCEIDAKFYRERETARLLGRRRRRRNDDDDVKIWPSVRQLWEYDIGLTPERPVVFLGSVSYARRFFAAYASPTTALGANRDAFRFLVGDFWGEPSEADDLYEIVVNASSLARSFVALRTANEGIDAFERHFNSIRANSTETMRRNPFLKAFWEDYFDCDIAAGTCDNSSALSLVERPILRNYQAASIIDAVFLLSSYAKEFRRANPPNSRIYFSTREKFFLDPKTNLQTTTTTNVTSWTGERVRVGIVRAPAVAAAAAAAWTQRVDWTYDALLLNGTSSVLVGRWDFNAGNGSLSRLGNYTWSKVCSTVATPTVAATSSWIPDGDDHHHQTESPPTSASRCSEERLVFLTLPGLIALLHLFVALYSVHKLGWSSFVNKVVFSVGGLLLVLVTVVSFSVSVLLCTSVFTCRSVDESWFHFAINLASIGVFAAIFVQLLLHQIGGCFDRFSYKVASYFAIVLAETILLVFVCFYRDEALIVASYFINVIMTTGSAILLWMPKKINAFRHPKAIATLAGLLAVSHASCVGLALWSSSNRSVFLIALSTFPNIVTLFVLIAVVEYQSRRPASSSNPPDQTELYRGPSHRYVEQLQQPIESDARGTVFTYWDSDIVREINSVLIEPERIKIEERIGQGTCL